MDKFRQLQDEAFRIAYLIAGYIRSALTKEEQAELDAWVEASDENMQLFEELTEAENIEKLLEWYDRTTVEKALKKTKKKIDLSFLKQKNFMLYAAALIFAVIATIFFVFNRPFKVIRAPQNEVVQQDALPAIGKAVLTLGNGQIVMLSSGEHVLIAKEGSTNIIQPYNGQIVYNQEGPGVAPVFNTLNTPRGGNFKVVLSDGTTVWLNAASKIKYPTAFATDERFVELTGEAYFEVKHEAGRPFRVKVAEHVIEVLGTQFNVNAYTPSGDMRTTLVDGKVLLRSLTHKWESKYLSPGDQAIVHPTSISVNKVDPAEVIAWKNGLFIFKDQKMEYIMQEVARWYDVDPKFTATIPEPFTATIPRNLPLSKLLQLLELTEKVHFKLEGKKLTIIPGSKPNPPINKKLLQ